MWEGANAQRRRSRSMVCVNKVPCLLERGYQRRSRGRGTTKQQFVKRKRKKRNNNNKKIKKMAAGSKRSGEKKPNKSRSKFRKK